MEIEQENQLACQICGNKIEVFSTKAQVQLHMITIHGNKDLQCLDCGKFFKTLILLKNHLKGTHVDLNIQCDMCDKKFRTKEGFKKHKISHASIKKEPSIEIKDDPNVEFQKCYICNDTFDKYSLESHLLQHENSERIGKVKCDTCDEVYVSQDSLRVHKTLTHIVNKRYACDLCNKTFTEIAKMKLHKKNVHEKKGQMQKHL